MQRDKTFSRVDVLALTPNETQVTRNALQSLHAIKSICGRN